jgi:2-polyprenyl-3-methyl-5-hydroxy-6-metoxy-1,4-benzoquinol methylase
MSADIDIERIHLQQTLYRSKNPTRRWLHTIRKQWVVSKIGQVAREKKIDAALEVGPGAGVYIPFLLQAADRVSISDCDTAYLDHVSTQFKSARVHAVQDDITRTGMRFDSFDLILFSEVIEHIDDSPKALENLYRLLKPTGALILTTPQKFSPLEMLSKIAYLPGIIDIVTWIYREPVLSAGHTNLMTENELNRQMSAVGFQVVDRYKSGLYLPLIAEFSGRAGLTLARALEKMIQGTRLDMFLWTQCYVLKKQSKQ